MPDQDTPTPDSAGEPTEPTTDSGAIQLPDDHPLVKTMRSEREQRKAMEAQLAEAQKALEVVRQESLSETEKAIEAARMDGEMKVYQALAPKLLLSEVQSSSINLVDPVVAARMIDVDSVKGDDGFIDSAKVASALEALVEEHPILVSGEKRQPDFDGGARSTPPAKRTDMEALLRAHVQT